MIRIAEVCQNTISAYGVGSVLYDPITCRITVRHHYMRNYYHIHTAGMR